MFVNCCYYVICQLLLQITNHSRWKLISHLSAKNNVFLSLILFDRVRVKNPSYSI